MIGIYKITNPKGRVYVGQSVDIRKRILSYKRLDCVKQFKIYRSLLKYGVDKHKFEVVSECTREDLNKLEIYFVELYNCVKKGLNCKGGGTLMGNGGYLSDETKAKIGKAHKGRVVSTETRIKLSLAFKGKPTTWPSALKGTKWSEDKKIEKSEKMKIYMDSLSKEEKSKKYNGAINRVISIETRKKHRISFWSGNGGNNPSKMVFDDITGIYYDSIQHACITTNFKDGVFRRQILGKVITKFPYLSRYKVLE